MSVFKEEVHVIEHFAKRQRQVYPDACDYGVFLNLTEKIQLREAVMALRSAVPSTVKKTKGLAGNGSSTNIFVPWEHDGDMVCGVEINITFWHSNQDNTDLFTIITKPQAVTRKSFENTLPKGTKK